MGMWLDDYRHGNGIIVTLDGLYFEGNFSYGKMTVGIPIVSDHCPSYLGSYNWNVLRSAIKFADVLP